MRRLRVKLAIGVAVLGVVVTATVAVAGDRHRSGFQTSLTGYEEVPALSTAGGGTFRAALSRSSDEIRYELRFGDLESAATQSHIHFEQRRTTAPIVVFLCSNLAQPAGRHPGLPGGGRARSAGPSRPRTWAPARRRPESPPASSTSSSAPCGPARRT